VMEDWCFAVVGSRTPPAGRFDSAESNL